MDADFQAHEQSDILILCAPDGTVEHRYLCDRQWGRIERDGHVYRTQYKRGRPDVYVRDQTDEERAYIAAVVAELERLDIEYTKETV